MFWLISRGAAAWFREIYFVDRSGTGLMQVVSCIDEDQDCTRFEALLKGWPEELFLRLTKDSVEF
ncbi:hypothetical protein RYX36_028270 [Vicia faba]